MAWCSVQRYLSIFHDQLFRNANKRFLFHYFPLIILLLYILIFYIIAIIFPPCLNIYNYRLPVCNNFPCCLNDHILGIQDSIINSILPTIVISIFNLTILVRVYCQKRRLHRPNRWRQQRKMTIQLMSTSVLYLMPNIPLNILVFSHLCGLSEDIGVKAQLYFDFLCYFVVLMFPFVCLGTFSELRKKVSWKWILFLKRPQQNATVRPQRTDQR
jgi:hypothetical protein